MATVQINELYLILTKVAKGADFRGYLHGIKGKQAKNTVTYGELSRIYKEITAQQIDAQFGWTKPLEDLNTLVMLAGQAPLSSVVICGDAVSEEKAFLPGEAYWGLVGISAKDRESREAEWLKRLEAVRAAHWPSFSELTKNPKVLAHFSKKKR